jgi:hypothetical protein
MKPTPRKMKMMFNEELATQLLAQATEVCKAHPLPEGDDFLDVLEDFCETQPETLDYTPEQDEYYRNWLAKRAAVKQPKPLTDAEKKVGAKAKAMAFYTADAIANELSPFDD